VKNWTSPTSSISPKRSTPPSPIKIYSTTPHSRGRTTTISSSKPTSSTSKNSSSKPGMESPRVHIKRDRSPQLSMEAAPQIHAHQSVEPGPHSSAQEKGVFCDGQHLHRESQPLARRPVKENIQTHQRRRVEDPSR